MKHGILGIVTVVLVGCGAHRVKVDPVTVEPIHVTVDVNVNSTEAPQSNNSTSSR